MNCRKKHIQKNILCLIINKAEERKGIMKKFFSNKKICAIAGVSLLLIISASLIFLNIDGKETVKGAPIQINHISKIINGIDLKGNEEKEKSDRSREEEQSSDKGDITEENDKTPKQQSSSANTNTTNNQTEKEVSPSTPSSDTQQSTVKPTVPDNKPVVNQPSQVEPPKEQPLCPNGENPNLSCDYIDLPAGYKAYGKYEDAKKDMDEADAKGLGYDGGWLTNNGGTPIYVVRFW